MSNQRRITREDVRTFAERAEDLKEETLRAAFENPDAIKVSPLFNQSDAAKYIGISRGALSGLLDEPKELIPRTTEIKEDRNGNPRPLPPKFSADQIEQIRQYLHSKGLKSNHSKRRPVSTKRPIIIMVGNLKGGANKTTIAVHLSQWLALNGYRVLAVDSDPQASFTSMLGFFSDYFEGLPEDVPFVDEYNTLFSLYSENNPLRPIPTYFANLDFIPANIRGYSSEYFLPMRQKNDQNFWDVLHTALTKKVEDWQPDYEKYDSDGDELDPVYNPDDYDVIVLDTSPSYSYQTMNALFASDAIIVPVPVEHLDILATGTFCEQMADFFDDLYDSTGTEKYFEFILGLRAKMSGADNSVTNGGRVSAIFRENMLNTSFFTSKAVQVAASNNRTVFEAQSINLKGVSSTTIKEAVKNLESIFSEVEKKIIQTWELQEELDLGA